MLRFIGFVVVVAFIAWAYFYFIKRMSNQEIVQKIKDFFRLK